MSIMRWPTPIPEPRAMRESMLRLFDDPFFRAPFGNLLGRLEPAVPLEIVEHDETIEVRAAVPGFKPEQIDVQLQGSTLHIRGTIEERQEEDKGNRYLCEWKTESFQRMVELPVGVDPERAEAHFVNGVLTLSLPKVAEQVSRKIDVKG